jgi:hypothetical protein
LKAIAIVTGAIILAAVTHVNIDAGVGYGSPQSYLMLAVTAGIGVSAFVFGRAWNSNRRWLAAGLVLAWVAGELFNLTATAERIVADREASQAPVRDRQHARAAAAKRVADAKAAYGKAKAGTSGRLEKAEAAKKAADEAVIAKASEKGCVANCTKLLQKAVDDAAAEVAAARAELTEAANKAEGELRAAEAALAAIKLPPSATPLADRLGLAPWIIDLFHSALGSVAANGLAFLLIAFGAHRPAPVIEIVEPPAEPAQSPREPRRAAPRKATVKRLRSAAKDHATRFGLARLDAGDGATELSRIRRAYMEWADAEVGGPLPDTEIAPALAQMFAKAGVGIATNEDGKPVVIGVAIKEPEQRPEVGRCFT